MQILLVNYEFPGVTTNCGGGGEVTRQLADGLTQRGHNVTVFTDSHDRHYATFPARTYRDLHRAIRRRQPDVINTHFALPTSLLVPAATPDHIPVVMSVMGADVHDPTRFQRLRPLVARVNRYLESRVDRVVAPSTDLADRFEHQTGVRPRRIHYGIDPDEWSWRERTRPEDAPVQAVSVARLVGRKNMERAVTAVRRLNHRGFDVEYRVVGTGPCETDLREEYGDHDWLTFEGYVEDLQPVFDDAHLFFLPSHHEAFGVVFLEALATGLPVVTSTTGGQTDIVTDEVGRTAPPDDTAALTAALENAIMHYNQLQSNTQGFVRREFARCQMVDEYIQLYEEVVAYV